MEIVSVDMLSIPVVFVTDTENEAEQLPVPQLLTPLTLTVAVPKQLFQLTDAVVVVPEIDPASTGSRVHSQLWAVVLPVVVYSDVAPLKRSTVAGPEGVPGAAGILLTVTAKLEGRPLPELFFPKTETTPEDAELEQLTAIAVVPCPDVMVAPVGTLH